MLKAFVSNQKGGADGSAQGQGWRRRVQISQSGLRGYFGELVEDVRQGIIARAPLPLWAMSQQGETGTLAILMYHRTAPQPVGIPAPTLNVTPLRFRDQMRGLLERGYQPWALRDVIRNMRAGRSMPPKSFVVTFDDGYANNFHYAWPVLKELRIPATIFMATAYLDSNSPFPFDDWSMSGAPDLVSSWVPLRSSHCREMLRDGLIDIASHTHTHQDFRGRPQAFQTDIEVSLRLLDDRFGLRDCPFAFPWGKRRAGFAGSQLAEPARRAGVSCGLTTESELVRADVDPFRWGRFTVAQTDTDATLGAKIDGTYTRARDFWRNLLRPILSLGKRRRSPLKSNEAIPVDSGNAGEGSTAPLLAGKQET